MRDADLRPALRALDVQRVEDAKGRGVVLVDRLGVGEPVFIPEALLPIVGRCTGERTIAEIATTASTQLGEPVPVEFVADVVRQLDERLVLIGTRSDAAVAAAARTLVAAGVRPMRHAGSAGYPMDPDDLRSQLRTMVPPGSARDVVPALRGLVAPHIDLARGHAGYAAAYSRLAAAGPADLYVIFGTGHAGPEAPVTGLGIDWQTPLGTVATDRAFVAAVHAAIGEPAPADLLIHRDEHSIEFQVLMLQHLHELWGGRPFTVAGFLCGALPSAAGDPLAEAYVQDLLAAFRAAAAQAAPRRIVFVAGADLAHIGPFFGDDAAIDRPRLQRLEDAERTRIALLQHGRPGAFHAAVAACDNPDRVCSAPAITLCATLADGRGELLHYGQATDADGAQTVSYCAMSFPGQEG